MKQFLVLTVLVLLAACSKEKPADTAPAPVTSVESVNRDVAERLQAQKSELADKSRLENEANERKRAVDELRAQTSLWSAEFRKVNGKQRTDLPPIVEGLRAIRRDVSFVATTPCTAAIRTTLTAGMDDGIAAIEEFRTGTGDASPELQTRLTNGLAAAQEADAKLPMCLTMN